MPLDIGTILNNRYRVVKLLGQGGFGAVYRAWDLALSRPCAVKENLELAAESQRQFSREASILANLNHPHLPRVYDHFILATGQYLVMDFIDGEDMGCMLQRTGKMNWVQAREWIEQVTSAVAYLHHQNPPVIHRDIKPANIRITPAGQTYLVDFGLVKYFDPSARTTQGARAVTPGYSPPEQYGSAITDMRTDLYALAATIYTLLTGIEPPESVSRLVNDTMTPIQQANPSVPQHVEAALQRAMQLRPNERYQNIDQFLQALQPPPVMVNKPQRAQSFEHVSAPAYPPYQPVQQPAIQSAPQKKSFFTTRTCLIIAGVVALGMVGLAIIGISALSMSANRMFANETATAAMAAQESTQQAYEAGIQATGSAQQEATAYAAGQQATEEAYKQQSTEAAYMQQATSAAQSSVQATSEAVYQYTSNHTLAYGPNDGEFTMDLDGKISSVESNVDLAGAVVDATFTVPYATSVGPWDIGFLFRDSSAADDQYRLVIQSDGTWTMKNVVTGTFNMVNSGTVNNLNTSEGQTNQLTLVFTGSQGWFYLNGQFISDLDLSARSNSGNIRVAEGLFEGDEVKGYSMKYSYFRIWSYP